MSLDTTRTAKGILEMAGHRPHLYVPGSLRILLSGLMEWDERCSTRCPHKDGICYMARSSRVPIGRIDLNPHPSRTEQPKETE